MLENIGSYEAARMVHVVASTLFAGGMASDLVAHAYWRKQVFPASARLLFGKFVFADTWLTPIMIVSILGSGFWMIWASGMNPLQSLWLGASLVLFGLSGIAFGARLMPLQKAIYVQSQSSKDRSPAPTEREALTRLDAQWNRWALVIGVLTLVVLLLMIGKPQ